MSIDFRDCFSNYFAIEVGKRFPDSDRQITKAETTLRKAFDELELRLAKQKENPDELNLGQPYFLVCAIGVPSIADMQKYNRRFQQRLLGRD